MSKNADVIVLGGGHNGLVAAGYLARAGRRTVVLEAREQLGGGASTEELWPGFRFSTCAHLLHGFAPKIYRDFRLAEHGVEVIPREAPLLLQPDGTYYGPPDHESERNRNFQERWTPEQHNQRKTYEQFKDTLLRAFASCRLSVCPEREVFLQSLTPEARAVVEQSLTRTVGEIQEQLMPDPEVRGLFALDGRAIARDPLAISIAFSTTNLEYPGEGTPLHGFVRGGMGRLSDGLASEVRAAGAEIRTGCVAEKILVADGRCYGVRLADGSEVYADLVFCSLDPKQTFLRLIEPQWVPDPLREGIAGLPTEVSCLKLLAVMNELPEWTAWDGDPVTVHAGSMMLNASAGAVAASYADLAAGRPPRSPVMSFNIPSFRDPSLTREGFHTASVWIYPAPAHLQGETWVEARDRVMDAMIDQITEQAPNFRRSLVHMRLRTPQDIAVENRMTDGAIWHVQHEGQSLFWNRPLPELRDYRCPIEGLILCGSGQHPGGEVCGLPGHNAAHVVLGDG